jgi:hypothetical protein
LLACSDVLHDIGHYQDLHLSHSDRSKATNLMESNVNFKVILCELLVIVNGVGGAVAELGSRVA